MKKVAVVILNWNGRKFLENFLPSVVKFSTGTNIDIFIADNGSTDDSINYLKLTYPNIKIIELQKNYGFAEGYNRALFQIDTDYFVLLNSDVEVTENWINPIVNFMETDNRIAACQPKIKSFYQKDYFEYAGAAGGFIDKYGYPFCRGRILNCIEKDNNQFNQSTEIFWATGACMFVKADVFKEIGGLDNDFFAHMEEIDFCWRLKNRNYKVYYFHEVEVFHVGGGTLPNNNPRKLFLNYRNNLFLLFKNLPSSKLFYILFIRMVLDGISASIYLLKGQFSFFTAVLKAHFAFYGSISKFRIKRKQLSCYNNTHKRFNEMFYENIVYNFFIKKRKIFNALNFLK